MIKTIIFDVDGVLLDSKQANITFYKNLLGKFGYKVSDNQIAPLLNLTMVDAIKTLTKETQLEKIDTIYQEAKKFPYPKKLLKLAPYGKETVALLSESYKLAIVTSRIKKGLETFFKFSKLKNYFDVAISFEDFKNPKPNPEPILIALTRLGLKSEEAIYIGDAQTDLESARRAGVAFINYRGLTPKVEGAKYAISDFKDLPQVISQINNDY
ncbi:MAG: HAD-IA family hydrolase [Candidatus Curtissbacteria bacterium]